MAHDPIPSVPDPDPMPVAPDEPLPGECCEGGCDPCVFDVYAEQLAAYREALARWKSRHPDAVK